MQLANAIIVQNNFEICELSAITRMSIEFAFIASNLVSA